MTGSTDHIKHLCELSLERSRSRRRRKERYSLGELVRWTRREKITAMIFVVFCAFWVIFGH